MLRRKFNHNYQAEIISFDVKYVMLIPHIIHRIEGLLNICHTLPFRLFRLCVPFIFTDFVIFLCNFGIKLRISIDFGTFAHKRQGSEQCPVSCFVYFRRILFAVPTRALSFKERADAYIRERK